MTSPVPTQTGVFVAWLNNFQLKIGGYAATLGLTTDEVDQVAADYVMLLYVVGQINVLKNDAIERTSYLKALLGGAIGSALGPYPVTPTFGTLPALVPAGIRTRCSSLVQRIKKHTAFTDSIGSDLNIMVEETDLDEGGYKARITKARATAPNEVTLEFFKGHSSIQGVNVYSRLQGTTEWIKLAFDSQSPYVDTTPLAVAGKPETREYRVRAVVADEEIGEFSDISVVTVS